MSYQPVQGHKLVVNVLSIFAWNIPSILNYDAAAEMQTPSKVKPKPVLSPKNLKPLVELTLAKQPAAKIKQTPESSKSAGQKLNEAPIKEAEDKS